MAEDEAIICSDASKFLPSLVACTKRQGQGTDKFISCWRTVSFVGEWVSRG